MTRPLSQEQRPGFNPPTESAVASPIDGNMSKGVSGINLLLAKIIDPV